jgi:hypothetical protein
LKRNLLLIKKGIFKKGKGKVSSVKDNHAMPSGDFVKSNLEKIMNRKINCKEKTNKDRKNSMSTR